MTDRVDERIHTMMQRVVDEAPLPPEFPREPAARARVPGLVVGFAVAVAVLIVFGGMSFLLGGSDGSIEPAGRDQMTTVPTTVVEYAQTTFFTPPISAIWTLEATLDEWLADPVSHNGGFYAIREGFDKDATPNAEGHVEGRIEPDGELWTSTDGLTWVRAREGELWLPPSTGESPAGGAVVVEYGDAGGSYGDVVADRLLATSDRLTWREINLRPYEDNWVPLVVEGGLGWLVYSPPREVWVKGETLGSVHRGSNLGLWYTPDTEAWFEVTDLGPLVGTHDNVGAIGVMDVAMIIRDDDILVFAHTAENGGFGVFSQLRTEIWRLELGS